MRPQPTLNQSYGFDKFEVSVLSPYQKVHVNQENVDLFKEAVASHLDSRGMSRQQNPVFLINISMVIQAEVQVKEAEQGKSIDSTVDAYGTKATEGGFHWQEVIVGVYKSGIIKIELVRSQDMVLVWTGSRSTVLWKYNENKIRRKIKRSINKIMRKFHPEKFNIEVS